LARHTIRPELLHFGVGVDIGDPKKGELLNCATVAKDILLKKTPHFESKKVMVKTHYERKQWV